MRSSLFSALWLAFLVSTVFSTVFPSVAQARVFNISESPFAAYVRATGGISNAGNDAFADSSGPVSGFPTADNADYNYSGEFGIFWHLGPRARFRLGFEALQVSEVTSTATATASPKNELLTVTSNTLSLMPMANFEFDMAPLWGGKIYGFFGIGYATVNSKNEYELTAAGKSRYTLSSDYKETVTAKATPMQVGVAAEWMFVDNTSLSLESGWRFFNVDDFEYKNTQATAEGNTVKGEAATDREIDLGGLFVGISFRFYIPPMGN